MRIFLAVSLEQQLIASLRAYQKAVAEDICELEGTKLRWLKEAHLHLTLKFLGEVREERLPEINKAIEESLSSQTEFEIGLCRAGCFPNRGPVRVVWAGVEDFTGNLACCAAVVEQGLLKLGFPAESRSFSPHVTLARVKMDKSRGKLRDAVLVREFVGGKQKIELVYLFQSTLKPSGAQYRVLAEYRLP